MDADENVREIRLHRLPPELLDKWSSLRTHAVSGAQMIASPKTLPLIIFSPGFGVSRVNC
jgi:hypothetical protein